MWKALPITVVHTKNGVLTWSKQLEAGEVWVVTFKVKVGKINGDPIKNKAIVLLGENEYTTNEVSNPIQKIHIPPIPETDDVLDLQLWFAFLLLSCVALFACASYGKRRNYR